VSAAARYSRDERTACALVLEAVQRRLVRIEDLRHELEAGPRIGSAVLRRAVEAAESGLWSAPEADLARLFATSSVLPPPWFNPDLYTLSGLRLPRPDAWFDEVGLAVQVHSYRHHARPEEWDGIVLTDGVLVEHGVMVLGFTPHAIKNRRAEVLIRTERTYEQARRRPRPEVVAVPIASAA
jgi:hypothetical protein